MSEELKVEPGDMVSVEHGTVIEVGNQDDDVVVKFASSPFEYCLPGSSIRRIPPAQAGSVAVKLCSWCGRTPEPQERRDET